ncbi:MAG: hypothetical protein HQ481_09040 [Alphaproteobacteria bacterium]|nr:hypothetical protein [Alphaproteobacteria bacterium]
MSTTPVTDPSRPALYAIYDLGMSPITFDVMNFFVFANLWSLRAGFGGYHVVFAHGPGDGFRDMTPKDKALDRDEKVWRLRHILFQHAYIARRCVGVSVVDSRVELTRLMRALHPQQVFPPKYTVDNPTRMFMLPQLLQHTLVDEELVVFDAAPAAVRKVDAWLARNAPGPRPVVLTLRTSSTETDRNSDLAAWCNAADRIRAAGCTPVVVPDTDLVIEGREREPFGDLPVYGLAALDLELRVALFRRAWLNLADNGGPAFLNYFMADPRILCFLPVAKLPEVVQLTNRGVDRMAELLGVKTGESFPFATPVSRFVWKPDTVDHIMEEFEAASAYLLASEGNAA